MKIAPSIIALSLLVIVLAICVAPTLDLEPSALRSARFALAVATAPKVAAGAMSDRVGIVELCGLTPSSSIRPPGDVATTESPLLC